MLKNGVIVLIFVCCHFSLWRDVLYVLFAFHSTCPGFNSQGYTGHQLDTAYPWELMCDSSKLMQRLFHVSKSILHQLLMLKMFSWGGYWSLERKANLTGILIYWCFSHNFLSSRNHVIDLFLNLCILFHSGTNMIWLEKNFLIKSHFGTMALCLPFGRKFFLITWIAVHCITRRKAMNLCINLFQYHMPCQASNAVLAND